MQSANGFIVCVESSVDLAVWYCRARAVLSFSASRAYWTNEGRSVNKLQNGEVFVNFWNMENSKYTLSARFNLEHSPSIL